MPAHFMDALMYQLKVNRILLATTRPPARLGRLGLLTQVELAELSQAIDSGATPESFAASLQKRDGWKAAS